MDCSWTIERSDGITFVAVRLDSSASVPRRVRLANRLDGPVLPPRREGSPEPGFDADGVTVGVPANESRSVGFACAAEPQEPPVEFVETERVDDARSVAAAPPTATALSDLGSAAPPRDAVPYHGVALGGDAIADGDAVASDETVVAGGPAADADRPPAEVDRDADATAAWFDSIERRIERGERLTNASVATATAVLGEMDGLETVSTLDDSLASDADRLREVAARATALADRAEAVDVPVEALRRLA